MPETMTPIRLTLRNAREAAELTQTELADKVGVRQATISDLENGKSTRIEFDLLDKLCAALNVSPGDLFEYEPRKRAKR